MNEDERSDDERSEYVHFDTMQQCIDFIQYIEKLNFKVGHVCCSEVGCEILNIDNRTAHKIKNKFLSIQLLALDILDIPDNS